MSRTEDIERTAALAVLIVYGDHASLNGAMAWKEVNARKQRMQTEYAGLMRKLWPENEKLCDVGREDCHDEYCPVHGQDIR